MCVPFLHNQLVCLLMQRTVRGLQVPWRPPHSCGSQLYRLRLDCPLRGEQLDILVYLAALKLPHGQRGTDGDPPLIPLLAPTGT